MESLKNLYPEVVEHLRKGERFALATIVEAHGSTPQVAGASALFSKRGLFLGTLGGGVVEADAQKRALKCLNEGSSLVYEFKLGGDIKSEEAPCGGSVRVLIDATPARSLSTFKLLIGSLRSRQPGVLVTSIILSSTGRPLLKRKWWEKTRDRKASSAWEDFPSLEELEETLKQGKPRLSRPRGAEGKNERRLFFLEPLFPLPRLVIVGAGHIGQAVAHLGKRLDFEVTVIDDRPEFASTTRFPEADFIIVDDIQPALRKLPISSDTYLVIATRGHRHDAEALRACISSPACYIGMIGSLRKVALMREEFLRKGWATASEFDRIHAPIGLKIGSRMVEEIAVSIAAELVLVRSRVGEKQRG